MLTLLAATLLTVSYRLPEKPVAYSMLVNFDGYVPALGGIEDAKIDVTMKFEVNADKTDGEGHPQAVFDLMDVELKLGGAPLPFGLKDVQPYFPKNTISHTPAGKILKTDAPDTQLPVRLPGLDIKRIPDITYMPIEFPEGGIEVGVPFEFKKSFGDSEVQYKVVATKQNGATLFLDVAMTQTYETLEDDAKNATKRVEDAVSKVRTKVDGSGTVEFDTSRGLVTKSKVVAKATSAVSDMKGAPTGTRSLTTTLAVGLKG